jgi:tripartite-type tricarboxylate transporter receptor subunit TctC
MGITLAAQLAISEAPAQGYPNRPVFLVVGSGPGTGTDIIARLVAPKLSQLLGQQVLVDNRVGAAGLIANDRVAKAPPDGYTLAFASSNIIILSALRSSLPYDLERDFAPVSLVATGGLVLVVHPSVPTTSVKGLIALARSRPGKLTYGSVGVGSSAHMAGELFSLLAGVKLMHIPFKGTTESTVATISGEIDMNIISFASALSFISAGKFRPLGVTTAQRAASLPSVPTLIESGVPDYEYFFWASVLAPAAVPKNVVEQLNAAIDKAVNTPDMKEALSKQGIEPKTNTPEQFAAFIRNDLARHVKLVKASGMKVE